MMKLMTTNKDNAYEDSQKSDWRTLSLLNYATVRILGLINKLRGSNFIVF
jgi:hypothetical protein